MSFESLRGDTKNRVNILVVNKILLGNAFLMAATVCAFAGQDTATAVNPSRAPQPASENVSPIGEKEVGRPPLQRRNPRYQVRTSDVLDLNFPFSPEFNQTVTVQPDGYITLHAVGDLQVEGLTVPELTQMLRTAYGKILHEPVVTVELKDFEKPYFIAGGEVAHPGKYDLRGDTTLTEAVAIAGGFTENSKHSQVLLFRRVSKDWVEVKKLNVKKMLYAANLGEDLHLRPGDMLFVPKNAVSKIKRFMPTQSLGLYFRSIPL